MTPEKKNQNEASLLELFRLQSSIELLSKAEIDTIAGNLLYQPARVSFIQWSSLGELHCVNFIEPHWMDFIFRRTIEKMKNPTGTKLGLIQLSSLKTLEPSIDWIYSIDSIGILIRFLRLHSLSFLLTVVQITLTLLSVSATRKTVELATECYLKLSQIQPVGCFSFLVHHLKFGKFVRFQFSEI